MFNLGSKEILIIALIILFLFGSKKLTEWAKGFGDAGRELKKAKKEFKDAMDETDEDIKKTFDLNEKIEEDVESKELKISKAPLRVSKKGVAEDEDV